MRNNRQDAKVHYKMYKDGKRWVYAGLFAVAISGVAIAPVILNPIAPVHAASTDPGYKYTNADDSNGFVAAIADGTIVDVTPNGAGSVHIGWQQVDKIRQAHMQLIINGDKWTLSAKDDGARDNLDSVLQSIGFPTDAQLANPTDPANASAILAYLNKSGLTTMNGGTQALGGTFGNNIISGNGFNLSNNGNMSANHNIAGSSYKNILTGSLDTNANAGSAATLITNGGVIKGSNNLSYTLTDSLANYKFSTGSFTAKMRALKSAVQAIDANYGSDVTN